MSWEEILIVMLAGASMLIAIQSLINAKKIAKLEKRILEETQA